MSTGDVRLFNTLEALQLVLHTSALPFRLVEAGKQKYTSLCDTPCNKLLCCLVVVTFQPFKVVSTLHSVSIELTVQALFVVDSGV